MGRCCAIGSSCWLVLSCGWSFVVLVFIVMDCEMGNCFSISKGKTTAFSVEWPFWLCTWTTDKKNTIKYSMGKHSELDSSLCYSSSVPDQFNWTKMELYHPYYLKQRGLVLPLTKMLICREWALLTLCKENYYPWGSRVWRKAWPRILRWRMWCVYHIHNRMYPDVACFMKNVLNN